MQKEPLSFPKKPAHAPHVALTPAKMDHKYLINTNYLKKKT